MNNIEIKITGSGTKEEILSSLESLIKFINSEPEDSLTEGVEFETETLMLQTTEYTDNFYSL